MRSSSLTSKGQITIPRAIRHQLGLHAGDRIGFTVEEDHILLYRRQDNVEAAFGLCKPKKSASLEDIEEATRRRGGKR